MNGIILYVTFCFQLLLLETMFQGSPLVAGVGPSFLFRAE